jgi:predicted porin
LALDVLEHLVQSLENFEMKKTLVALAALAATSAFAQSAVTMYGVLDAGFTNTSKSVSDAVAGGTIGSVKETTSAFGFNNMTQSRIGFKGTEDLGQGVSAAFTIETGISSFRRAGTADAAISTTTLKGGTGTNGTTIDATSIGNRELNAALTKGDTTVGLGFGGTAIRSTVLAYDAAMAAQTVGNLLTSDGQFASNRALGAGVSQKFGGLTLSAAVSRNQTALEGDATKDAKNNGTTFGGTYNQGPWSIGYATQKVKTKSAAVTGDYLEIDTSSAVAATRETSCTASTDITCVTITAAADAVEKTVKTNILGTSYDLGFAKLFAQHGAVKTSDSAVTNAAGTGKRTATSVGAQFPMGKLTPFVQWSKGKVDQVNKKGDAAVGYDRSGYILGAKYDFSKRTFAYGYLSQAKLDGSADAAHRNYEVKMKQTSIGLAHAF